MRVCQRLVALLCLGMLGVHPAAPAVPPGDYSQVPTKEPVVFLTFDAHVCEKRGLFACDDGVGIVGARKILKSLRDHKTKITFFFTAAFIEKYPDLTLETLADGHEIGSHLKTHVHPLEFQQKGITLNRKWFLDELLSVDNALRKLTKGKHSAVKLFRMPYGLGEYASIPGARWNILAWAAAADYTHVDWTIDTMDWVTSQMSRTQALSPRYLTAAAMKDQIIGTVRQRGAGVVVLSHLYRHRSESETAPIDMLGLVMPEIERLGMRVQPIGASLSSLHRPDQPAQGPTQASLHAEKAAYQASFSCNFYWSYQKVHVCLKGVAREDCRGMFTHDYVAEDKTCECLNGERKKDVIHADGYVQITCR